MPTIKPKQVKRPAMKWFVETKPKVPFTKVLAQFPNIRKKEIRLLKYGDAYTDISAKRRPGSVSSDVSYPEYFWNKRYKVNSDRLYDPKEKLDRFEKLKYTKTGDPIAIHTHPSTNYAFVSVKDIKCALHDFYKSDFILKQNVVIALDSEGNQIGRTFYNMSKKTYSAIWTLMYEKYRGGGELNMALKDIDQKLNELNAKYKAQRNSIEFYKELHEYYAEIFKVKFKFQAMPGYKFNKELIRFEKIK